MEIREARPDEYAAAGEVTVRGYEALYGENLGGYGDRLRDVASRVRSAVVLIAVVDETIVGTVTYVPSASSDYAEGLRDGEAGIRMLTVLPAYTRRGIGRALSIACVERARAEGKRAVALHADGIVQASQRMYETLGFRRDPARDFRADDDTTLIAYVFELRRPRRTSPGS
jgi:GNAT superfamily N-acetyltransferase